MTKTIRSIFSIVIAVAMICSAFPMSALAADGDTAPLGQSGTITAFENGGNLGTIDVALGTTEAEAIAGFPETVSATVALDGDETASPATTGGEISVDIPVSGWSVVTEAYDANREYIFVYQANLDLPDGLTLATDAPMIGVNVGGVVVETKTRAISKAETLYFDGSSLKIGTSSGTASTFSDEKATSLEALQSGSGTWWVANKTLYLNNFDFTTTAYYALMITTDATINLTGTNTITSTADSGGYGIAVALSSTTCSLTVTGSGTLTVSSDTTGGSSYGLYAKSITLEDSCTVNVKSANTSDRNSYALYLSDSESTKTSAITVSSTATLTAESGEASGTGYSCGIYVSSGIDLAISGTVKATAGGATLSHGTYMNSGKIIMNSGELQAYGATSAIFIQSLISNATVKGGTNSGDTDPLYYVNKHYRIANESTATIATYAVVTPGGGTDSDGVLLTGDMGTLVFDGTTLKTTIDGGKTLTPDSTWSISNNALNLHNFNYTTNKGNAIQIKGTAARINLIGNNTIKSTMQGTFGLEAHVPITVAGSGKLTITADVCALVASDAISGVTIKGGRTVGADETLVWYQNYYLPESAAPDSLLPGEMINHLATYAVIYGPNYDPNNPGDTAPPPPTGDTGNTNSSSSRDNTPAPNPWLDPTPAQAKAGDAANANTDTVRTKSEGTYGVRKDSWKNLKGYTFSHDTVEGNAVMVRVSINDPAAMKTDALVSAYVTGGFVEIRKTQFEKWFGNEIRIVHMDETKPWGQDVRIAAKVDLTKMNTGSLYFYSYDKATNSYKRITSPQYRIDKNGYLHFYTPYSGDIVISSNPLERR